MRALPVLALLLAACVKPVPVNLLATEPPPGRFGTPRPCSLAIAPVVDARPLAERDEGLTPSLRYLVPLVIIFVWETAGPRYAPPELYAQDLVPDLGKVLKRTIDSSGLCAGGGPSLTLRPTLRHYVGLSYEKTSAAVGLGGGATTSYSYFPAGQVDLELELFDGDRRLDGVVLSERYLFNEDDPGMSTAHSAAGGAALAIAMARPLAPKLALEHLLGQVPDQLDRMLAGVSGAEVPRTEGSFLVVRLTREYDFEEEMRIETATGRIVTDRVVRRRLPILSAPNEWVVAPVDAAGRWMRDADYRAFVATLGRTYDVGFGANLSVAEFRGLRKP